MSGSQLLKIYLVICLQSLASQALIVPDEIPTLLSVIYSNIPTLKKGTDSRLGWGFKLGNRADFQFLVELGPQLNTQPLANQPQSASSKRNAIKDVADVLYAQRKEKPQILKPKKEEKLKKQVSENSNWLQKWSQNYQQDEKSNVKSTIKSETGVGEVDAKLALPDDTQTMLDVLYKKKINSSTTTLKPKTTTSYKDALDNVDLE